MEVCPLLVQYEIRYSVLEVANEGGGGAAADEGYIRMDTLSNVCNLLGAFSSLISYKHPWSPTCLIPTAFSLPFVHALALPCNYALQLTSPYLLFMPSSHRLEELRESSNRTPCSPQCHVQQPPGTMILTRVSHLCALS